VTLGRALLFALALLAAAAAGHLAGGPRPGADDFRAALAETDVLRRVQRMSGLLLALDEAGLPAALEAVEERRVWLSEQELRVFMHAWVRFDAEGAFEHALGWPDRHYRKASAAAIYAWGIRDPEAARRSVESLDPGGARERLEETLFEAWLRTGDKRGATGFVASLPASNERQKQTVALAHAYLAEGREALRRWAESVPDDAPGRYKLTVFRQAAIALAQDDPAAAAAWIANHLDRSYSKGTARLIVGAWAQRDAPAALAWVGALPPGRERDTALARAFDRWLAHDPRAAQAWLEERQTAEGWDAALAAMARAKADESPPAAIAWAERIRDPLLRERSLVGAARTWLHVDPRAAERWLSESELSEGARARARGAARSMSDRTRVTP
jgi:hypothetical protein